MNDHHARYEALIQRFVEWASGRTDVRGAFIVGSRARSNRPADEWSDLDMVMFADEPEALLQDEQWASELGPWEISFREPTAVGIWEERRVLFANGCDADFSILPARLISDLERVQAGDDLHSQTAEVIVRGYRVVVDKDGRLTSALQRLAGMKPAAPQPPSQRDLDQALANFWYHCVWMSRKVRRGELMVAHECLDGLQRQTLIQLIRWLAQRDGDTWHESRFFEQWVPPTVQEQVARTFARHDAADVLRALTEMMALVSRLAGELAGAFSLSIDPRPEAAARAWIGRVLED